VRPLCASVSLAYEAHGGGAGTRRPPWTGNPGGEAARHRPPAGRGTAVSPHSQDAPIHCCRRHHMVYSPRPRQWITVPEDFIAELRQADFPVELMERHCPQCYEEIYARLKPQ
jgi:hypothetical protein